MNGDISLVTWFKLLFEIALGEILSKLHNVSTLSWETQWQSDRLSANTVCTGMELCLQAATLKVNQKEYSLVLTGWTCPLVTNYLQDPQEMWLLWPNLWFASCWIFSRVRKWWLIRDVMWQNIIFAFHPFLISREMLGQNSICLPTDVIMRRRVLFVSVAVSKHLCWRAFEVQGFSEYPGHAQKSTVTELQGNWLIVEKCPERLCLGQ